MRVDSGVARDPEVEDSEVGSDGSAAASIRGAILRAAANPSYRFVFLFVVYLGIEAVAYPLLKQHLPSLVKAAIVGTAHIEYALLSLLGGDVSVTDRIVTYAGFPVTIIEECTGIYEIIIFAAAVLAFPTSARNKLVGFAWGAPLIYLFNVIRILVLIVVGRFYRESFEFMHIYFWQATMIAMITSVWLLWIVKVVRHENPADPSVP